MRVVNRFCDTKKKFVFTCMWRIQWLWFYQCIQHWGCNRVFCLWEMCLNLALRVLFLIHQIHDPDSITDSDKVVVCSLAWRWYEWISYSGFVVVLKPCLVATVDTPALLVHIAKILMFRGLASTTIWYDLYRKCIMCIAGGPELWLEIRYWMVLSTKHHVYVCMFAITSVSTVNIH